MTGHRQRPRSACALVVALVGCGLSAPVVLAATPTEATFCVGNPTGCVGTTELTIGAALTAAASSPATSNTIEIAGGHTYTEDLPAYSSDNTVTIEGVGANAPVITPQSAPSSILRVDDGNATLKDLTFNLPNGFSGEGLELIGAASASAITVTATGTAGDGAGGVVVDGTTALSNITVDLPGSTTVGTTGISIGGSGETVSGATVNASDAIDVNEGASGDTISAVRATAPIGIEFEDGMATGIAIDDSVFDVSGSVEGGGASRGALVNGPGTSLALVNDTFYDANDTSDGIDVYGDGGTAAVAMTNTIVDGFTNAKYSTVDLYASGSEASVTGDYDDWATSDAQASATITRATHDVNLAPDYVNAAAGDFHLAAGSPLIDKGDPTAIADAPATDVYGADRYVAGLGGCSLIPDIGAAEYQVTAPTAVASGPSTAYAGQPLTFLSAGSCGPGAMSPLVSEKWTFSDGANTTGASVTHTFLKPGAQTATLTVTTETGASASKTVDVSVGPPELTELGLGRAHYGRRPLIAVGLSAPGTVRFTVGEWIGARQTRHGCQVPGAHGHGWRPCRGHKRIVRFNLAVGTGIDTFSLARGLHRKSLTSGLYIVQATSLPSGSTNAGGGISFTVPQPKLKPKR